jgi:hypothetical protein
MLYTPKTNPGPSELLEAEKLKISGTYRIEPVILQIKKDFFNKCYLCDSKPQSINIEHFLPHKGNLDLKFSWENLFWSCSHCNNIKGDNFKNILNCTTDRDIEGKLDYVFSAFPSEDVLIIDTQGADDSEATAQLLMKIYNGSTLLKKIESNELRKNIARQLLKLNEHVLDFEEAEEDPTFRAYQGEIIKSMIRNNIEFASFSRSFLKRFPTTLNKLRGEVPDFPI